jgi:hypothetical protein
MHNGHCLDWLNVAIRLNQSTARNKKQQSMELTDQLANHLFREFYRIASKLSAIDSKLLECISTLEQIC